MHLKLEFQHWLILQLLFENIVLFFLPSPSRKKSILSFLDDKIELNNKINANLEQQTQALFKNWFVDLEQFVTK